MKTINRIICSLLLAGACTLGAVAQENQSYFLHTIEKGQSLYSIASMYGVSQADIIKLNPGSDERIFIGRTLRIPRSAANAQKETYHTIASGETLYRLTVKYNVSAKAICDANPGLSAENFRIGQVILIPSTTEAETMAPTETLSKQHSGCQQQYSRSHRVALPRHAQGETERNRIQHQPRIRHQRSRADCRQSGAERREQNKEGNLPLHPLSQGTDGAERRSCRPRLPTASCSAKTEKRQSVSAPSRLPSSSPSWTGYRRVSPPVWWNTTKAC